MRAEIYWVADVPAGRLAVLPRPRGGDWLEDELRSLRDQGVDVLVSLLTSEEAEELQLADEAVRCGAAGVEFVSFPVPDRDVPDSGRETLALVRRLRADLAAGKGLALHCRQGVGRSALIAACVPACFGVGADEAFARVARARGCPVPDTAEQREWVGAFAERHLLGEGGLGCEHSTG